MCLAVETINQAAERLIYDRPTKFSLQTAYLFDKSDTFTGPIYVQRMCVIDDTFR